MASRSRARRASIAVARVDKVERPIKASEYEIRFASTGARNGWVDLRATTRNALADAWDFLTRTPLQVTPTNYPLRGALGGVCRDRTDHQRWQHKPTLKGDARIGSTSSTTSYTWRLCTPTTPTPRSSHKGRAPVRCLRDVSPACCRDASNGRPTRSPRLSTARSTERIAGARPRIYPEHWRRILVIERSRGDRN